MSTSESDQPSDDGNQRSTARSGGGRSDPSIGKVVRAALHRMGLIRSDEPAVRDALDELIEEAGNENEEPLGQDERTLLANILSVRDRAVEDVMVPRADIVAVDSESSLAEVIDVITSSGHSRLPVYRETLDDAIGMVHIKDVLAWRGRDSQFQLSKLLRRVLFVAPSMQVLHLLLEMRASRTHMALVVDEFGGVDGLITIEDLVEEIVGHLGRILSEEERDEIDTLGGLVVSLAGRVPVRGELIRHPAGLEFEVLEADPRRIIRVKVRHPDGSPTQLTDQSTA